MAVILLFVYGTSMHRGSRSGGHFKVNIMFPSLKSGGHVPLVSLRLARLETAVEHAGKAWRVTVTASYGQWTPDLRSAYRVRGVDRQTAWSTTQWTRWRVSATVAGDAAACSDWRHNDDTRTVRETQARNGWCYWSTLMTSADLDLDLELRLQGRSEADKVARWYRSCQVSFYKQVYIYYRHINSLAILVINLQIHLLEIHRIHIAFDFWLNYIWNSDTFVSCSISLYLANIWIS